MVLQNLPPTAEMQAMDAAHHMHPFTQGEGLAKQGARIITRAEGVYLWDSEGNRILDGMAGLWCVNVGYGQRRISDAVHRQMQQLPYYNTFFMTSHPPALELAAKLAELAPGNLNHVFFNGSGSETNDTMMRMVRHYWALKGKPEKTTIISRHNAYHGSTMAAASLGGMNFMHAQGGLPIPGIRHIAQPYWYGEGGDRDQLEYGLACARQLETEIDRLGEDKVAAFIAEPVQGAGGVIIPPDSYWPEISRICAERDILLVVDEVICGFGRTGHWFGSQAYDLDPDILSVAKGLSSGYLPIAATIVSDEIAGVIGKSEFAHGYTYSAHPACCAAALANIAILEEDGIIATVAEKTAPHFATRLQELADHELVGEVRSLGLMAAIELTPDKSSRAPFASETGHAGLICRERCFENGLVMRHVRDSMILSPPLVITTAEIDDMVRLARKSLDETAVILKQRGLA